MLLSRDEIVSKIASSIVLEKKILLIAGNGGSASIADHLVGELVGRFKKTRKPYPAISLSASSASITCIANDFSYDEIFSRQLQAFFAYHPTILAMSTSGRSRNIVQLLQACSRYGLLSFLFGGNSESPCSHIASYEYRSPFKSTDAIQEDHLAAIHRLCAHVDRISQ